MRYPIKSRLFGSVLADGSFISFPFFTYNSEQFLNVKKIDITNHAIWTGRRSKEQTEISTFISRFNKNNR